MMDELINRIHQEGVTLALSNDGKIYTFHQRGIADLYYIYTNSPELLNNAIIADKVVGKGAATIMIAGGVKRIHADVISIPAMKMLETSGIEISYTSLVPHIWNRTHTDWCPVEKRCCDIETISGCLEQIKKFIEQLKK